MLHDIAQHLALRRHVQCRGRLVQQQDRCVTQYGAGNGNALRLPLRKASATLADLAVDRFGDAGHKIPCAGNLQRLNDLLVGGVLFHHPHILRDRTGEDGVPLRHVGKEIAAVRVHLDFLSVRSPQQGNPAVRVDQAKHQSDHRGLSLAGGPHQRNDLTGRCIKIGVGNDVLPRKIRKAHVLHTDLNALLRQLTQFLALGDVALSGQFDQLPDTVSRDGAGQKRRDDAHDAVERTGQSSPLLQKQRHRAVGDLVCPQQIQAVSESRVLDDHAHHRHKYACFDREQIVVQADFLENLLPFSELFPVAIHHTEGFDRVEIVKCFDLKAHHLAAGFFDLFGILALLADKVLGHQQHDRRAGKRQQGHDLAVMPDDKKRDNKIVDGNDDGRKPPDGVPADRAHITVKAVQKIAVAVFIHSFPVHIDDLVKDVRLDVVVDINIQLDGNPVDQVGKHQAEYSAAQHDRNHQSQLLPLIAGDDIHQILAGHAGDQSK